MTDPANYKCLNNQGAHLISHLVQKRLWSYLRLPIEGLKSVVFHGNSPTLCIGAGNVWVENYNDRQRAEAVKKYEAEHPESGFAHGQDDVNELLKKWNAEHPDAIVPLEY